jgi:hypothetical protein
MSYKINEMEIKSVLNLRGPARYEYFVKRIADWEEIWGLRKANGWETAADNEGREMLPLWPHERFAQLCATGGWSDSKPAPIELNDLLEWVPELSQAGRLVAVFPLPDGKGIPVHPRRLEGDILEEQSKFEE